MLKQRNTKIQGNIGMSSAIHYFTELGYIVSVPLTDAQDYDLIVEIDDKLCKVQCKTTNAKDGTYYCARLSTCGGNKSRYIKMNEVDIYYFIKRIEIIMRLT